MESENATYEGIVFDLDGTLVDSLQGIADAANRLLRQLGHSPNPRDQYRKWVGAGLDELIRKMVPETADQREKLDQMVSDYQRFYQNTWKSGTVLYPGIRLMLLELHRRQIPMAILSNKTHRFVTLAVKDLIGKIPFVSVEGLRSEEGKKPNPKTALAILKKMKRDADRVLMVGDSPIDMQTARNAGMIPAGVLWGFQSERELVAAGASLLFSSPGEILNIL